MRIPQILPRRRVETNNFCYVPETEAVRELQAENERLRAQLLNAYDRVNTVDDARHAEARRQESLFQIIAEFTDDDWHGPLHCDHLDALPIGTVIRAKGLAWTRIGVDTVSGHALWLTPTEDEAFTSEQIDSMFVIVSLAWVPGAKESN